MVIPNRSETIIALDDNLRLAPSELLAKEVKGIFGDKVTTFKS